MKDCPASTLPNELHRIIASYAAWHYEAEASTLDESNWPWSNADVLDDSNTDLLKPMSSDWIHNIPQKTKVTMCSLAGRMMCRAALDTFHESSDDDGLAQAALRYPGFQKHFWRMFRGISTRLFYSNQPRRAIFWCVPRLYVSPPITFFRYKLCLPFTNSNTAKVDIYTGFSLCNSMIGNFTIGLKFTNMVGQTHPDNVWTHLCRAASCAGLGQFDLALASLMKVSQRSQIEQTLVTVINLTEAIHRHRSSFPKASNGKSEAWEVRPSPEWVIAALARPVEPDFIGWIQNSGRLPATMNPT